MLHRFTLKMSDEEFSALQTISDQELRDFREQARLMIRSELIRKGALNQECINPQLKVNDGINKSNDL